MDNYSYNQNLLHNPITSHSNISTSPYASHSQSYLHYAPLDQYPPSTTPRNVHSNPSLVQSLDLELPSEYALISQTPEERAILLELLKERRRVKEIELRILEEQRRAREAVTVPAISSQATVASPGSGNGWQDNSNLDLSRITLSAMGTNQLPSQNATDYPHSSQPRYSHQQLQSNCASSSPGSNYIYDQGLQPQLLPAQQTSTVKAYDQVPSGLGPANASRSVPQPGGTSSHSQEPFGNLTYPSRSSHVQQHPPVIGSPESSTQQAGFGRGSHAPAPRSGLWDSPAAGIATPSIIAGHLITSKALSPPHGHRPSTPQLPGSAAPLARASPLVPSPGQPVQVDLDLQPLHIFDDANYLARYTVSSSGGSSYDEPSPPQHHFLPTPPQQHLQYPDPGYQHPSMQVKHQRLSDPSTGPAYHPSQPQLPLHVFSDQTQANPAAAQTDAPVSPVVDPSASARKPKKLLLERQVSCQTCQALICKMLVRGTAEELAVAYEPYYECARCVPPAQLPMGHAASGSLPASAGGAYGSGGGGFSGSGLRITRKRTRQTEDTSMPTVCDVCIRTIGRGGLVPRVRSTPLVFAVEIVCTSCANKYSRCSDCGGGSGRVGVGKWRAKELFENGRKTCKLPHVRVGGGELELSVWEVPWEIQDEKEFPQLMSAIRALWSERVYARLAIPEVLEGGEEEWSPAATGESSMSPEGRPIERTFKDVEDCIAKGWPAREKVLCTTPSADHDHFRRYLGLSWAKSRARRERAAGKMPDPAKYAEGDEDVLAENVRRTNVLVPAASTLVGMWIFDWDVQNRTVLLSTSAPFEPSDAEDKNIIGVGELFTRLMTDLITHNMENPSNPLKPPQHLWIATRSISALGNARMNDTLTRRRGFAPVDEYIALHPGTDRSLFSHAPEGHGWFEVPGWKRQDEPGELEVLVRWLADEMDMSRLDELKDIEYGRKSKEVQIASRSRKVAPMPTTRP